MGMFFRNVFESLRVTGQAAVSVMLLVSTLAHAQAEDIEPPTIGPDINAEAIRGESQIFTVSATDNEGIESIGIYYRLSPDNAYVRADMTRLGETDLFSFTIPAESIPSSVDVIQYYIEARDFAGNRTLRGFSFSPVERTLVDQPGAVAAGAESQDTKSTTLLGSLTTTQKIVYGALGVIVVGALISAASGGGGSGSSGSTVPVTIFVDPLDVN